MLFKDSKGHEHKALVFTVMESNKEDSPPRVGLTYFDAELPDGGVVNVTDIRHVSVAEEHEASWRTFIRPRTKDEVQSEIGGLATALSATKMTDSMRLIGLSLQLSALAYSAALGPVVDKVRIAEQGLNAKDEQEG